MRIQPEVSRLARSDTRFLVDFSITSVFPTLNLVSWFYSDVTIAPIKYYETIIVADYGPTLQKGQTM